MIAAVVAVGRTTRRVMTMADKTVARTITVAVAADAGGGASHLRQSCDKKWKERRGQDLPAPVC